MDGVKHKNWHSNQKKETMDMQKYDPMTKSSRGLSYVVSEPDNTRS